MARLILCCGLLVGAWQQESGIPVSVVTKDGQRFTGTSDLRTLKVETTLGSVEVAMKDVTMVGFDKDVAAVQMADGNRFRGTLALESITVKGTLGAITLKRESLATFEKTWAPEGSPPPVLSLEGDFLVVASTKDGNSIKGTVELKTFTLESSIGKFDVDIRKIYILKMESNVCSLTLRGGTQIKGKLLLEVLKLRSKMGEFSIKSENLQRVSLEEVRPAPNSGKPPPAPPAPLPPGMPDEAAEPAPKPLSKAPVKSNLCRFVVTPDGKRVYAVNALESKLMAWSLPGLEKAGEVALKGVEGSISIDPAGTRLFAGGNNSVSIVELQSMKKLKTFDVEQMVLEVHALDGSTMLATSQMGSLIISTTKTAIIRQINGPTGCLRTLADSKRIFTDGGWFILGEGKEGSGVKYDGGFTNQFVPFELSPDGRYQVGLTGQVYRVGKGVDVRRITLAKVPTHLCAAFSLDSSRLFLFTEDGNLKIYETTEFGLISEVPWGYRVHQIHIEKDGTTFLAAAWPLKTPFERSVKRLPHTATHAPVNLYRFELPK